MITRLAKNFLLGWVVATFHAASLFAQNAPELPQYEVKAAFLYNFIKFVEWPEKSFPEKDSPFIIGVLGTDPFSDPDALVNYLDQATSGKTVHDRKIVIRRSRRINNLRNCHLIFISASEKSGIKETLATLNQPGVLTIGETDGFCQQGGIINFFMAAGKVRFEINTTASEKNGLKISSKLLNVAKIVSRKPE